MRWHPDRCAELGEVERLAAELIFKRAHDTALTPDGPRTPPPDACRARATLCTEVNLANEILCDAAKRRAYDAGSKSVGELVRGVWQSLTRRMSGKRVGVVVPRGATLAELARQEQEETGLAPEAALLLGPAEDE